MTSDEIFDAIEHIASISSTKLKLEELKKKIQDEDFCNVCLYAYHPHFIYNMKDFSEPSNSDGRGFNATTWGILDDLKDGVLSGNEALEQVGIEMQFLSPKSGELLSRIIRKDLRCGVSKSTINKARPNLIPTFPYMRCALPKDAKFDKFSWESGCISQEKADGMFLNCNVDRSGYVFLYGREGNLFKLNKFKALVDEIKARLAPRSDQSIIGWQYHGEVLIERDGEILPREIANGLINSANNGDYEFPDNERVLYKVWDRIPLTAIQEKRFDFPYKTRFAHMCKHLLDSMSLPERKGIRNCISVIETRVVASLEEAKAHFKEMTSKGKEGTILKNGSAIWKDGTSKEQIKFKVEFDCDLKIVGFVEGQKATKNEGRTGSITCESSDGKLRVDVSIKGEAMRDAVDANKAEWLNKIMTVKANNIMPPTESNESYSLFLPRFVETFYRSDKSQADSLEQIQTIFDSAI